MKNQLYYSTNLKSDRATFREALLKGLAPDGGLYMPESIPFIERDEMKGFSGKKYFEIAFSVLNRLIGNEIDASDLLELCRDAYYFDVPLEKVNNRKYILCVSIRVLQPPSRILLQG